MVSPVKWEGVPTAQTLYTAASTVSVANNAISDATGQVEFDNETALGTYGWLELTCNFTTAPSDTLPSLDIYRTEKIDGTNSSSPPVTSGTQQDHMRVASFPVRKVTGAQRIGYGPIDLPPFKQTYYLDNQAGAQAGALPAGWGLKLFYTNIEGQ